MFPPMSRKSEDVLGLLFFAVLSGLVAADGGVPYSAAAVALAGFGALLFASARIPFHRPQLHRLRFVAVLLAVLLCAIGVFQVWWDPSGRAANPLWRHLTEAFGETGGARAGMRLQPIWELPGLLLPFVAFAAAIPIFRSERASLRLWSFVALLGSAFACYGLLQATFFPRWHFGERVDYVDSLSGFYVNRNAAAGFLVLTASATLVLVDRALGRTDPLHLRRLWINRGRVTEADRELLFFLGLFALQFVALVLTKSRAGTALGLIALVLQGSVTVRANVDRLGLRPSKRVAIVLGLIAAVAVVGLTARLALRYEVLGLEDSRWCVYPSMIRMAVDNLPWGVGMGGFVTAFSGYRRAECGLGGVWDSAHDGYIQGVATIGVFFPVILAVILASVLPPLLAARRGEDPGRSQSLAVSICAAALACHSVVDFPLEIPATATLLAVMIASAIGTSTDRRGHMRGRERSHRRSTPSTRGGGEAGRGGDGVEIEARR